MRDVRLAGYAAIGYSALFTIWFIGGLIPGNDIAAIGLTGAGILLVTQCLVSWLMIPWLVGQTDSTAFSSLVPLILTPWPLYLLLVHLSNTRMMAVVASQLILAAMVGIGYASASGLTHIRQPQVRTIALVTLQVVPAALFWSTRGVWTPWFTG